MQQNIALFLSVHVSCKILNYFRSMDIGSHVMSDGWKYSSRSEILPLLFGKRRYISTIDMIKA